jgi:formylglycine-generating enzyme required for sulfatase activity
MLGNVEQWTEDCWHNDYKGAPQESQAWLSGDCKERVVRGGSWESIPRGLMSSNRFLYELAYRDSRTGFRLARDLKNNLINQN